LKQLATATVACTEAAAPCVPAVGGRGRGKREKSLARETARCNLLSARLDILNALAMPEKDRCTSASPFNLRIMKKDAKKEGRLVFLANVAMPAAFTYDAVLQDYLCPSLLNRHGD